jgi:hypothetical protein
MFEESRVSGGLFDWHQRPNVSHNKERQFWIRYFLNRSHTHYCCIIVHILIVVDIHFKIVSITWPALHPLSLTFAYVTDVTSQINIQGSLEFCHSLILYYCIFPVIHFTHYWHNRQINAFGIYAWGIYSNSLLHRLLQRFSCPTKHANMYSVITSSDLSCSL